MNMCYNGWKNKETWLVSVWFGDSFQEEGHGYCGSIREYVEDMIIDHEPTHGFLHDIIATAMADIDWEELENHYQPEEEEEDV